MIHCGDVSEILPRLDAGSFDACLCDPPYGIRFMGREWDHGVPSAEVWAEALRALKPGAFLMAFGGTRTHHRLVCAIEDAGFEIRDCLMWLYGSGFPKSHDISKAIDRAAGAEREVAASWFGYGTALKPSWEPIILAMKPCEGTFAANALGHGVAGLNVDGGRVEPLGARPAIVGLGRDTEGKNTYGSGGPGGGGRAIGQTRQGRWPANLLLSHTPFCREVGVKLVRTGTAVRRRSGGKNIHSDVPKPPMEDATYADPDGKESVPVFDCHPLCAVRLLDEQAGGLGRSSGLYESSGSGDRTGGGVVDFGNMDRPSRMYSDFGGPSRFFYCAKASTAERNMGGVENRHPTLKPIDLCRYLATLLLPPKRDTPRRLLVPFSGAGSEVIGALRAGWDEVDGIERAPEHVEVAEARIKGDAGPLFAGVVT